MELRVLHITGSKSGQEEVFNSSSLRLGREPSNDIAFDPREDIVVSGRHAELSFDGRDWIIRDLGSSNGTFIGGERVSVRAIRSGENVQLGRGGPKLEIRFTTQDIIPQTTLEDLPPRDFPETVVLGAEDLAAARETTVVGLDFRDAAATTFRQDTMERSRLNNSLMRVPAAAITVPPPKQSPKWIIPAAGGLVIVAAATTFVLTRPAPPPRKAAAPPQQAAYASRAELDKLKTDLAAREAQLNELQQKVRSAPQISVYASKDLDKQVRNAQAMIDQLKAQLDRKNEVIAKQQVAAVTASAAAAPVAAAHEIVAAPVIITPPAIEETFEITAAPKTLRKRLHVSAESSGGEVPESLTIGLARSLATVLSSTGMFIIDPSSGPHVDIGVVNYQVGQHADGGASGTGKFRGTIFGRKRRAGTASNGAYDVALTAAVGVYDARGRQLGSVKPEYAVSDTQASTGMASEGMDVTQVVSADTPLADTVRYILAASADEVLRSADSLDPEITARSMAGDIAVLDGGRNVGVAQDDIFEIVDGNRAIARARIETVQDTTATAVVKPPDVDVAGKPLRYLGVKRGETAGGGVSPRTARTKQNAESREGPGNSFRAAGSVLAGSELRLLYTVGTWSRVRVGDRRVWVPTSALDIS